MKNLFSILLFFSIALASTAQTNTSAANEETANNRERFMDHVTKADGKGRVTVLQDQRLTDYLNGYLVDDESKQTVEVKQVVQKINARGFRIQVYWGGNQKSEKGKAQMAGYKVTALFPELEAYTSFESPHWRCRVGDFATQKEAAEYLKKIKKANIVKDPIIVKSKIFVFR